MPHSLVGRSIPSVLLSCLVASACNVDEPATYEPRSGTWTYTPGAMATDTCNPILVEPMQMTTFLLDYDDGDSFQIEQGTDDIACEIDGTTFTCNAYLAGEFDDNPDAVISYWIEYSGEFLSATEAEGHRVSSFECVGEQCVLLDMVPCSRDWTFTAEFAE